MILAIDVGNTNIVLGVIGDDAKTVFTSRISTDAGKMTDQYAIDINDILTLYGVERENLDGAVISSVVPQLAGCMCEAARKITGTEPIVIGPGIKTAGLDIKIDNPAQLGADLVAAAVAAGAAYTPPIILFDMGTATTISVIDKNGAIRGGAIMPGVRISLDALIEKAALLQGIPIDRPGPVIGTNTVDCMRSGLIYGCAAMIDGMIRRIEAELGQTAASIIATGGLAKYVIPYCERDIVLDDNLMMSGLYLLYKKNAKPAQ